MAIAREIVINFFIISVIIIKILHFILFNLRFQFATGTFVNTPNILITIAKTFIFFISLI